MSKQPPTGYKVCRYDPERGEVVVVREGVAERIDRNSLNPEVRKQLEKFLAEQGEERKSA
ncbi:MAG: hypothetical protein H6841_09180 [Planctomycetes bacterium]|nr:hypothetical protein [Planctomycetota bacterium]